MKKIRETRSIAVGRGQDGPVTVMQERIIEVDTVPEGAEVVKDSTPVTDWVEVK